MITTANKILLVVVISSFVLLSFGAGVYYAKGELLFVKDPKRSVEKAGAEKDVPADMSKTYVNTAYGFKLSLPTDTEVYSCKTTSSKPVPATERDSTVFIPKNKVDLEVNNFCRPEIMSNYFPLIVEVRFNNDNEYQKIVSSTKSTGASPAISLQETTTKSGSSMFIRTKVSETNRYGGYKLLLVNEGEYIYEIKLYEKNETLEKIAETFDTIPLSGLKSDWIKYSSEAMGIEIRRPNSFEIESSGVNEEIPEIEIFPAIMSGDSRAVLVLAKDGTRVHSQEDLELFRRNLIGKKREIESGEVTINGTVWKKTRFDYLTEDLGSDGKYIPYESVLYLTIKNGALYMVAYGSKNGRFSNEFGEIVNTLKLIGR